MKSPNEDKLTEYILIGFGIIPVILAALTVAPFLSDGLAGIVKGLTHSMNNPINIQWCADSPKAILVFFAAYGTGVGVYFSTRRNYRRGEEHGSAKWGNARRTCKKYAEKDSRKNLILTQNVRMGLDGRKHRRNLNVLVVGGSGAGKTRFYAKPNIMQANTSYWWNRRSRYTFLSSTGRSYGSLAADSLRRTGSRKTDAPRPDRVSSAYPAAS